jgi:ABC-type dipeptide/oligopeptide/nickel transport system permease subunit
MAATTTDTTAIPQIKPVRRATAAGLALRRFVRNKVAMGALIFILLQVLVAVFAKYIAPYDPYFSDYSVTYAAPNAQHLLGTDDLGRDLLSRLIYGTRVSYSVGVLSQIAIIIVGLPLGALAGLAGGWFDFVLTRIIDILSSIPGLLLYILLVIALGAGLGSILIAMSVTGWIGIARLIRGQVLTLKESDYVRAARSMGGNTNWILRAHMARNALTPIIVSMTLGVPGAMFGEAGLSFLGLGIPAPTPSWGQMIGVYASYVRTSPHLVLYPSLILAVTMLAWILLGDGVRDALDPNIRS